MVAATIVVRARPVLRKAEMMTIAGAPAHLGRVNNLCLAVNPKVESFAWKSHLA